MFASVLFWSVTRAVVHDGYGSDFNEELGTKESWSLSGRTRRRPSQVDVAVAHVTKFRQM
jgi:hypothetical protein